MLLYIPYLPIYLSTYLSIFLPINLSIYLSIYIYYIKIIRKWQYSPIFTNIHPYSPIFSYIYRMHHFYGTDLLKNSAPAQDPGASHECRELRTVHRLRTAGHRSCKALGSTEERGGAEKPWVNWCEFLTKQRLENGDFHRLTTFVKIIMVKFLIGVFHSWKIHGFSLIQWFKTNLIICRTPPITGEIYKFVFSLWKYGLALG